MKNDILREFIDKWLSSGKPGPYAILDSRDLYLTKLIPGKTRRGWSKYLQNAAVFDTPEAADQVLRCVNHTRTAKIVRLAS